MAYSAEESSPIALVAESCCVCNEEFSSDRELTSHLIDHANDEEFKAGLLELEKKSPVKKVNPSVDSTPRTSFSRAAPPLKRTASQRSGSPEVWEIISDDSDDEKSKKTAKASNSFRLVSTPSKPTDTAPSTPNNSNPIRQLPNELTQNKPKPAQNKPVQHVQNVQNTPVQNKPVQNMSAQKANNSVVNGQTYKCHLCSSVFTDANVLKEHLLAHGKDKQFVCHICKKQFLHKATLRQHLHLHIGDKSHQCKVCNKKFSLKSVLRKHEETHVQEQQNAQRRISSRRQKSL